MRIAGWVGCALWMVAGVAAAQDDPFVHEPPTAAPMDVVMTTDGGMVRGTIIESVPGQYVVITLPTGETRRIEGTRVRYAGPASGAPQSVAAPAATYAPTYPPAPAAIAPPASDPRRVSIRFRSAQTGVTVHRVTGTATATMSGGISGPGVVGSFSGVARGHSFARLCTAPCEMSLDAGEYQLALSAGGLEVPAQALVLDRDGTVTAEYWDNSGTRVAGWLTFFGGLIGGLALATVPMLVSLNSSGGLNDGVVWPTLIGGTVMMGIGVIVGLFLKDVSDGALVRFD